MNDVVNIARTYINTPYHHQARVKGHGVDCVGLIICVAREIGYIEHEWDIIGYNHIPDGFSLMKHLKNNLIEVSQEEMQPGDVVCVSFDKYPQHVGIAGDYLYGGLSIIHASGKHMKVIETRLMFSKAMKFEGAFRFKDK